MNNPASVVAAITAGIAAAHGHWLVVAALVVLGIVAEVVHRRGKR